jgi:CelD/BcsL family acetyltransferase involved in cellulose biosynthesis
LIDTLKISREDFESITAYYINANLNLNWNLIFTLPAWLRVWWQNFASRSELYLCSIKHNEKIIGLSPLQIQGDVASLIGSKNVCDYQDFIISPGYEKAFFITLINDLKHKGIPRLHLETIRPDSTVVKYLIPLSKDLGFNIDFRQTDVSSDIVLPGTWSEYLKILDSKQRHELKRKMHNLNDFGETAYRSIIDKPSIAVAVDTFLNLFPESRSDKAEFLTPEMKNFFRSLTLSLSEIEAIGFGVLESSGQALAMVMYFDYNNNIYLYNSAYNPDYKSFSIGIISKALCIQDSILKRKNRFDFLKGSELYKFYLGGQEIPLYCCDITLR